MHTVVHVDTDAITDWDSFHDVFASLLGFPTFYGRNMNAWVDCMSALDAPEQGMSTLHVPEAGVLVLHLPDATDFANRCPAIFEALISCTAFVNYRRLECGEAPLLTLSYFVSEAV